MTERLTAPAVPAAFAPRRALRSAAALTSGGLIVGMGAVGATPAFAATEADCTDGNTVDIAVDTVENIQTLLDADTAIVCLSGTFPLTSPLTFNHDLTLFGLDSARLDGAGATQLLEGVDGASLTVQNIAFTNGFATRGGAIEVDGDLEIVNSTFTGNTANEDGGAIYVNDNALSQGVVVTDSTFTDNSTGPVFSEFDGYSGGAIYVDGTVQVGIEGSTFSGNEASELGGAVAAYAPIIETSTFNDNTAPAGGALYSFATAIFESTFADNSAEIGGAVTGYLYSATFGSTFVGNTAEDFGGAIASFGGFVDIVGYEAVLSLNSTFVENTAGAFGGAIYGGQGQIAFSTFLENRANSSNPGEHSEAIFSAGDEEATQLGGNIFAGSRSNAQLGSIGEGGFDDLGGNVFSTTQAVESALGTADASSLFSRSVSDIFGADPELGDNGGATETVALIGTSPAINAVPDFEFDFGPVSADFDAALESLDAALESLDAAQELSAAVDTTDVDQRNEPRTGLADAGAFEFGEPELGSELADTGPADPKVLGGFAALLLGIGAAFAIGTRRLSRDGR